MYVIFMIFQVLFEKIRFGSQHLKNIHKKSSFLAQKYQVIATFS